MEKNIRITLGKRPLNVTRLNFLINFLNVVGCKSFQELGDRAGLTRQMIKYILNKDDINVSHIYRIIDSYGYQIKMEYVNPNENSEADSAKKNSIKFFIEKDDTSNNEKLYCITAAMNKYNISIKQIEDAMHIARRTLNYRFKRDDSTFSMLTDFAEKFGLTLKIDITKKTDENQLIEEKTICKNMQQVEEKL